MLIKIENIIESQDIQSRTTLYADTISDYAEAMANGAVFPPVVVFEDPGTHHYWLADGFHRLAAYRANGINEIDCEVHQGDKKAALVFSCGSNATHGLPRTNADKRRAVTLLLQDEDYKGWSTRQLADVCKVSHTFVNKIQNELTNTAKTKHVADFKPAWEKESFIADCQKWPDVFITNTHLMLALKMSPTAIAQLTGKSESQVLRVANPALPSRFEKRNLDQFTDLNSLFAQDYDSNSDTWTMLDNAEGYVRGYEQSQKYALYSGRELNLIGALYLANQHFPSAVPALEYVLNQNQYLLDSAKCHSDNPSPFEPFPVNPAWDVLLYLHTEIINEAMRERSPEDLEDWEWNPPRIDPTIYIPKALAAMCAADLRYANGVDDTNQLDYSDWGGTLVKESERAYRFVLETSVNFWMWDYINQSEETPPSMEVMTDLDKTISPSVDKARQVRIIATLNKP